MSTYVKVKEDKNNMDSYTYKVKCRCCGKITEMYFGRKETTSQKDFRTWATEHATFPIQFMCECDLESMTFHDMVSFTITE